MRASSPWCSGRSQGERGWAGWPDPPLCLGQASQNQLQERVFSQRVGVVMVLVAASYLVDPLAHQGEQRMPEPTATTPLGDVLGYGLAQPELSVGLGQPQHTTI